MYLKTKIALFAIAALSIAACDTTTTTTSTSTAVTPKPATVTAPTPAVVAAPKPAAAQQLLADGTYRGQLGENIATLVISGGKPVLYTWGSNYRRTDTTLSGNTVRVQDGRLVISNPTANGFSFRWTLGTYTTTGTMTRS